jgi:hypothetical protein
MLVGYMRVSTEGDRQVLDLQRDALLSAGVDERHLSVTCLRIEPVEVAITCWFTCPHWAGSTST